MTSSVGSCAAKRLPESSAASWVSAKSTLGSNIVETGVLVGAGLIGERVLCKSNHQFPDEQRAIFSPWLVPRRGSGCLETGMPTNS